MHGDPAVTHDLIRLREPIALLALTPVPSWVAPALRRVPWVAVRRGRAHDGLLPVGVRGLAPDQRFAGLVVAAAIAARLAPEDLAGMHAAIGRRRRQAAPALAALPRVALRLQGRLWGPGGSVGFELATGAPAATWSSDLDLILRQERWLEPQEAADLRAALAAAAAPARIDVVLETPRGGVALADLVARPACVLVRTPEGPRLAAGPWRLDGPALDLQRASA